MHWIVLLLSDFPSSCYLPHTQLVERCPDEQIKLETIMKWLTPFHYRDL